MPYTRIVGQDDLRLALELTYINPVIGGVLIQGERGTAKSTAVRAFTCMMIDELPVTLPINATEDRVIGGWRLDELLQGRQNWQKGLLEQANNGFLYIDEVNLLDDHIVNLLLDASSTDVLTIQRDGKDEVIEVSFGLIGTMNPEEGELRPQLLDRFGLCVDVKAETEGKKRHAILKAVLEFDQDREGVIDAEQEAVEKKRQDLELAYSKLKNAGVELTDDIGELCVQIAQAYNAEGHRGDYVLALAAKALAARDKDEQVTRKHILRVAKLALQHRLIDPETRERITWNDKKLKEVLNGKQD
jgi:magnesium chelatase subunit I